MLTSPTAVTMRRELARRADALLATLRLVEDRPRPAQSAIWVDAADIVEPEPEPEAQAAPEEPTPTLGLSRDAVQKVLDEMVRPALQSDGGDISLIDVIGGDVMVQLVGACHSCPAAVLTMKMGVEQLLAEELDGFERLIQVEGPPPGFE